MGGAMYKYAGEAAAFQPDPGVVHGMYRIAGKWGCVVRMCAAT